MIASLHLSYVGVLLAVFAEQLCLPIPSVIFLMAAGALAANGEMRIDIIVLLSIIGCLQQMDFGSGWAAGGVLKHYGYYPASLPIRENAQRTRTTSFGVMALLYCVWQSLFPA
jgi:membrane protein DedA with SNARE-associated domain